MDLTVLCLIVLTIGLLFVALFVRGIRRRSVLGSSGSALLALLFLALAGLLFAAALNVHTYQRLTHEQKVAELEFAMIAPNQFVARIRDISGNEREFEIIGDEWLLEARVLKWHGLANLFGADTLYRLDRLGGRFQDIELERVSPRSVYALADEAGLDIWKMAQHYHKWLPWIDASYGSATYLPMADQARFSVMATQSGLIGRPMNDSAKKSVDEWQ